MKLTDTDRQRSAESRAQQGLPAQVTDPRATEKLATLATRS